MQNTSECCFDGTKIVMRWGENDIHDEGNVNLTSSVVRTICRDKAEKERGVGPSRRYIFWFKFARNVLRAGPSICLHQAA